MKKKETLAQLVVRFGSAARCQLPTSQRKANNIWNLLRPQISDKWASQLVVAWSHATMAERSPRELDRKIKQLVAELSL